jgi:molybdopterin-guanine dinucleotide biosynthesis protein A
MNNVLIAILAGGQSTRMGRDKALLRLEERTLLERTASLCLSTVRSACVVGRERPNDWPQVLAAVCFLPDAASDAGPLGGLVAALSHASESGLAQVLALPCDLPLLERGALEWILAQQQSTDGVVALRGEEMEPLFSLYSCALLTRARQRLQEGRRSLRGLIESADFARVQAPAEVAEQLRPCNTPEEWREALERRAESRS